MKNIAIILAGGSGKRFGGDKPKQLLPLEDGRSVLEHSVAAFRACECIDEVVVVIDPLLAQDPLLAPLQEEVTFVRNGRERWESSWNALTSLSSCSKKEDGEPRTKNWEQGVNVLIHDAARPFVSRRIIEDVCRALETHEAVTVAVPATDTMYKSPSPALPGGERLVAEIPDRATMMRAQTPQAFRLELIKHAYEIAVQDPNLQATDDCGVVYKYLPETPIYIVEGEEANRKITYKEDLEK